MSSDFTGTPGAVFITVPMLDDGDRPSAQLWRQTLEPIVDSIADLDTRTGGVEGEAILASGGLYTLSALLTINTNSFAWRFDNGETTFLGGSSCVFESTSSLHLESGADLVVESGGEISVSSGGAINLVAGDALNVKNTANLIVETGGDLRVESGGDLVLESGADLVQDDGAVVTLNGTCNMSSTGELNLASGADIVCADGAQIQLDDPEDLLINASSTQFRLSLTPTHANGWDGDPGTATWVMGTAVDDPDGYILFPFPLKVGDTVTTLRMIINGGFGVGHAAFVDFDAPLLQLIRVSDTGVVTVIQSVADPTTPNTSYDVSHAVTLSGGALPYTNASADPHYIRILAEGGAVSGVAGTTRLTAVDGTGIARSYRQPTEVL